MTEQESRYPGWYQDLYASAAEAQEMFSGDELERFAKEWLETDEGKAWTKLAGQIKWTFGSRESE